MTDVRFGLQLWSQQTTWPEVRESALAAEAAGWDSIWTWDHLLAIQGPWQQPIFEGWTFLAGVAAITSRVRLGLMVGANTFRNPGLTAKLATTLDHVSNGRAVLGILAGHCADVGRALGEIELTVSFPTIIRDRVENAQAVRAAQLAHNGLENLGGVPTLTGPPQAAAEMLRPYLALGFSTVIVRMPAPFDRETIDRLPEVLALLRD